VLAALMLPAQVSADAKAGEKKAELCLLCHKVAYASQPMATIPLLQGLPAGYLYRQIRAFKERRRAESVMQTNVAGLSDRDMRDIADYLSQQRPFRGAYQLDPAKVAMGKARADELKCAACHLPTFRGAGEAPRLAGQTPGYLEAQLAAFASGQRPHGSGPRRAPALTLSRQAAEALAQFLASLE
jgi:cytochrome c553